MINTKNIILIASITVVLGFGIAAFQTNTISVDALMDNTSEILDIGEKSEITTLAKPTGGKGGKTATLEGKYEIDLDDTTIKCSASNILSCTIKNSGDGLANRVILSTDGLTCVDKNVKDGASRASINTRKVMHPESCKYNSDIEYKLIVFLNSSPLGLYKQFSISFDTINGLIDIKSLDIA